MFVSSDGSKYVRRAVAFSCSPFGASHTLLTNDICRSVLVMETVTFYCELRSEFIVSEMGFFLTPGYDEVKVRVMRENSITVPKL